MDFLLKFSLVVIAWTIVSAGILAHSELTAKDDEQQSQRTVADSHIRHFDHCDQLIFLFDQFGLKLSLQIT